METFGADIPVQHAPITLLSKINSRMWRSVKDSEFHISRLILTAIEGNAARRTQLEHEMQFFNPQDLEESEEAKLSPPSKTQMLKLYHDGGRKIDVPCWDVIGVLMPSEGVMAHIRKKIQAA